VPSGFFSNTLIFFEISPSFTSSALTQRNKSMGILVLGSNLTCRLSKPSNTGKPAPTFTETFAVPVFPDLSVAFMINKKLPALTRVYSSWYATDCPSRVAEIFGSGSLSSFMLTTKPTGISLSLTSREILVCLSVMVGASVSGMISGSGSLQLPKRPAHHMSKSTHLLTNNNNQDNFQFFISYLF
jgi:hypothetical protein